MEADISFTFFFFFLQCHFFHHQTSSFGLSCHRAFSSGRSPSALLLFSPPTEFVCSCPSSCIFDENHISCHHFSFRLLTETKFKSKVMNALTLCAKKLCILYCGQPPLCNMMLPNGSRPKNLKEIEHKR